MEKFIIFLIISVLHPYEFWSAYTKPDLPNIALTAKATSTSTISLRWSFVAKGLHQYKVFRANATTGPFTPTIIQNKKPLAVLQATQKTFQIDNLEPATNYCYVVVAYTVGVQLLGTLTLPVLVR